MRGRAFVVVVVLPTSCRGTPFIDVVTRSERVRVLSMLHVSAIPALFSAYVVSERWTGRKRGTDRVVVVDVAREGACVPRVVSFASSSSLPSLSFPRLPAMASSSLSPSFVPLPWHRCRLRPRVKLRSSVVVVWSKK